MASSCSLFVVRCQYPKNGVVVRSLATKVKSGRGKDSQKKGPSSEDRKEKAQVEMIQKFVLAAEAAKQFKPKFSEDEQRQHETIAREYQVQMRRRSNRHGKDIACKIWLQEEALRSLPLSLQKSAEAIDEMPPPSNRPWALYQTPPLKGFDIRNFVKKVDGGLEDDLDENVESK